MLAQQLSETGVQGPYPNSISEHCVKMGLVFLSVESIITDETEMDNEMVCFIFYLLPIFYPF